MLRPIDNAEPFIACILAVGELQDRHREAPTPPRPETFGPGRIVQQGVKPPGAVRITLRDWARFYGLTQAEFHDAWAIRAKKDFTAKEAVEIVFRSRRPNAEGAA